MTGEPSETTKKTLLERAVANLSEGIRIETVTNEDISLVDLDEFRSFHDFLDGAYPLIRERLEREVVGEASLLYTWPGTDPGARPLVFAAHIDVVPVEPGTLGDWTHPPFAGATAGGFIWGRGTMDCKGMLVAIMEAVESLLEEGYAPERTVYLAFGQDEEVGGHRGAERIADLLESRGVNPGLVVDEGGVLADVKIPGFKRPLAAVGIGEKGYLTVELKAETAGGHSSMPPRHTAIGILAKAVCRLERRQFPARLGAETRETLARLVPELPAYARLVLGKPALAGLLMKAASPRVNVLNAMLRTTTAVTMIRGGTKDNVLPQEAAATMNLRIYPGETVETVTSRIRKVVSDDRVTVRVSGEAENPTPASSLVSAGYGILDRTIKEIVPDAVVLPYLVLGMTDARHYSGISDSVYRFCPIRVTKEDQDLAHGTDERIGIENFGEFIQFYRRLVINSSTPG